MADRFNKRGFRVENDSQGFQFENLEPRNMLAADWGIANPYSSSLLTHIANDVPVAQQMEVLRSHLNADSLDSFQLINHDEDLIGFEHFKYQHYYNGVPVESSHYTVHAKDGLIISLSGEYHDISDAPTSTAITEAQALDSALEYINANSYIWEDAAAQSQLAFHTHEGDDTHIFLGDKHDHDPGCCCGNCVGDSMAVDMHQAHSHGHEISFELPQASMGYLNNSLIYKFDIYAVDPMSRNWIFVDAATGDVVDDHNQIHEADVPATGPTLYDTTQPFTADFTGTEFRLREIGDATNGAVETYDLNSSTSYGSAVDFTSSTAHFGDTDHEVGNQTHWGTEQTWQYFFTNHGRDSFDDAGTTLRSYVSYGNNYVNAFWNGSFMTYGDGNGTNRGPLVSLDIVGHELAHGVVQFTAGLIYRNHSGALNESFADIFGESVENYARGSNDWLMGGDIGLNGNAGQFRSMQNPNQFNDPDTYLGDYWYVGNGDNGGVHINSGVQNKWYYIMVNGESGTNDTGHTYNVTGVGLDDAGAIAYRNLSTYLTANSTYPDARAGAVQSAVDLFGAGSQQHLSTMAAWDAVGVYAPTDEFDLYPIVPQGSQVFGADAINEVKFDSDVVEFELGLDANQLLTLSVANQSGTLIPVVTVTDSSGAIIGTASATSTTDSAFLHNLPIVDADIYTISVAGDASTIGFFDAELFLNAGLDLELLDLAMNDTFATAQNIDGSSIIQGHVPNSLVDRLAVIGDLQGQAQIPGGGEDFETGTLDPQVWETFSSTPNGQILVASDTGTPDGNFALAMDVIEAAAFNLNEAIMTIDLSGVTDTDLTFSHASFGDENHVLPTAFFGSFNGDGVSISEDGQIWHTVFTGITNPNGFWDEVTVDLDQAATDAGITLGADFKIKFQQYDNFPRVSDGRAYDNILVGGAAIEDWYSLTIDPGQSITVLATEIGGPVGPVNVDIWDGTETLLASGTAGSNVIDSYIENYVSVASTTETVYVRVSGNTDLYSLVVSRGGAFDLEDGFSQDITGLQGVVGYVSASEMVGADPDALATGDVADTAFAGVTLSESLSGGSIFAVTSAFVAPTGTNVFGASSTNDDGFRQGNNEFRADFDNLQSFVSIDVGGDDTLDVGRLQAFDAAGNLLQEVTGQGTPINGSETLIIQRPVADIAYVVAFGIGSHTAPLDNLVFLDQVIDSDVYTTDATVGDTIEFRTYVPGGGPLEFTNNLEELAGKQTQMLLVDPGGNTVAVGSHIIEHKAEMTGTYELIVLANAFGGEYYVTRDTGVVTVSPIGRKFLDGSAIGGSFSDIGVSDDVRYQLAPSPTSNPFKQTIDLVLVGEAAVTTPTSFGFRLEASMSGGPVGDVMQQVEFFNYVLGGWEVVDVRPIDNAEISIDLSMPGAPDQYVHQTTMEMLTRVSFTSESFASMPYFWNVDADQAAWRIGEY